jgi:hypothetical protein
VGIVLGLASAAFIVTYGTSEKFRKKVDSVLDAASDAYNAAKIKIRSSEFGGLEKALYGD